MHTLTLGRNSPKVSALGLGCMGLSAFYGHRVDDAATIALIHKALEWGLTLFDIADIYGPHTVDRQPLRKILISKYIPDEFFRNWNLLQRKIFLSTKKFHFPCLFDWLPVAAFPYSPLVMPITKRNL